AVVGDRIERRGPGHAEDREIAGDALHLVAVEAEARCLERDCRESLDVEEIFAAQVLAELDVARVDRRRIDENLAGARARATVDGDLSRCLVEAAALHRDAE